MVGLYGCDGEVGDMGLGTKLYDAGCWAWAGEAMGI